MSVIVTQYSKQNLVSNTLTNISVELCIKTVTVSSSMTENTTTKESEIKDSELTEAFFAYFPKKYKEKNVSKPKANNKILKPKVISIYKLIFCLHQN